MDAPNLALMLIQEAERESNRERIETYRAMVADPLVSIDLKRFAAARLEELE